MTATAGLIATFGLISTGSTFNFEPAPTVSSFCSGLFRSACTMSSAPINSARQRSFTRCSSELVRGTVCTHSFVQDSIFFIGAYFCTLAFRSAGSRLAVSGSL
uniref:Putative secreted protein n=1 Tax=Anopheles darlingi TaxID=43151 RepID=A0A2M4DMZ8_ANODA